MAEVVEEVADAEVLQAVTTSNKQVDTESLAAAEVMIIVWYLMLRASGARRGDEVGVGVRTETDGGEIGRGHRGETEPRMDATVNIGEVGVESESAMGDGGQTTVGSGIIGASPSSWRRC